jgi:ketosteroid isomerase-like protein
MSEHANTEEIRIKALLEAWANAVRRHDVPASRITSRTW